MKRCSRRWGFPRRSRSKDGCSLRPLATRRRNFLESRSRPRMFPTKTGLRSGRKAGRTWTDSRNSRRRLASATSKARWTTKPVTTPCFLKTPAAIVSKFAAGVFKKHGVVTGFVVHRAFEAGYYAVFFEDPCGNRLEVCHRL